MKSFSKQHWQRRGMVLATIGTACLTFAAVAVGGSYRDSAHGNSDYGVNRSAIDPALANYATGNCAHCHESHASIEGREPEPSHGAAPKLLFARSFNRERTANPYLETDNFCFYCHNEESGPRVRNEDYSATFGGALSGSGPQSILAAFNQTSYHNLYDIRNFLRGTPGFGHFTAHSNPCSACHNPHLTKRNHDPGLPGFPLLSAITRPNEPGRLWGESETMADLLDHYEAPFAFADNREPAGVGQEDGTNTPDYVTFCTTCHNPDHYLWSTAHGRYLKKINWGNSGLRQDKHGALGRDGADHFREPYASPASHQNNFLLSCLDCHEPHGSENIRLLRRRVNGEDLEMNISALDETMSHLCRRCHTDDQAAGAGTGEANRWEYVHHLAPGAPYVQNMCGQCHDGHEGGGSGSIKSPIACGHCHGHGMNDSWAGDLQTGRRTF